MSNNRIIMSNIIINNKIFFKTAISHLLISNHNSFRVLFDTIASVLDQYLLYIEEIKPCIRILFVEMPEREKGILYK